MKSLVICKQEWHQENYLNTEHQQMKVNKDFLTVGGMGHANQIALGLAKLILIE